MPIWLTESEYQTLRAACSRMIPSDNGFPGAYEAGVVDYIDTLLGAFTFDPPRVWAGGPSSGRMGGEAGFVIFHELNRAQELAWRIRIEGSCGLKEREFNGPVIGLQQIYREGISDLGDDFCEIDGDSQDERLRSSPSFAALLYEHCCEGMYGAPEYGGNRDGIGWKAIGFLGDVHPRGFSDEEVASK